MRTHGRAPASTKLDHRVARSTVAKTLKEHGIKLAPDRPTSWHTFLRSHAEAIAATDFLTVEAWTARGLVTHQVLFVIDHATRAVEIAGITAGPDSAFVAQVARNLTANVDRFLRNERFLILDRDTKSTAQFKRILKDAGVTVVTASIQAPNMNAIADRFVLSIKSECLNRLILFGTGHAERAVREFTRHYNVECPQQGIDNELIAGRPRVGTGDVEVRQRLGGMLKHYHRAA